MAGAPARGSAAGVFAERDQALAPRVRPAVLRLEPVQAVVPAERPEGRVRRIAVAAQRLARAQRSRRGGVAPRAGRERSRFLAASDADARLRTTTANPSRQSP